jgi:hypothetical protein
MLAAQTAMPPTWSNTICVSCSKLAAQKAMLNRGEAPAAQLFAISEEAEIRYTNGGLLYEVPAAERSDAESSAAREVAARAYAANGMTERLLDRYQPCAPLLLCLCCAYAGGGRAL